METTASIEKLEPRWAPARLVAGPLPAEFGADLTDFSNDDATFGTLDLPKLTVDLSESWSLRDPGAGLKWTGSFGLVQEFAQPARGDIYALYFAKLAATETYVDSGTGNVITRAAAAALTAEQVQTLLERVEASESLRAGSLMSRQGLR